MPSTFGRRLRDRQTDPADRAWVFVPYDQLSDQIGPLAERDPRELGVVLIENAWKARRRPYHKQKLALILANMRHFALEQAGRGVAVRYLVADEPYREVLRLVAEELGPLLLMRPAEHELRVDLQPLASDGRLIIRPHEGWLTTTRQFERSQDGPPWRMDAFYRHVRRDTGILMDDGRPLGGRYSLDAENRQPWPGDPPAPADPDFPVDEVKREVAELVEARFATHPGQLDPARLPATAKDADRLWEWARRECMANFGPYEDAMSRASGGLFHTRVSALLNLHRLLPRRVVDDVLELEVPLASKEGFIRQVLGWREFVRHVHEATDGFRLTSGSADTARRRGAPKTLGVEALQAGADRLATGRLGDPPARPDFLEATTPLPGAWWGARSGLACLDEVVGQVWREGYSHHITRLMILSNIATLLDVDARELTDWFWVAYTDAYDWVVEPNVLGMGTFAAGDLMTTKPYVSGAAYIHRMSDFCEACEFDPEEDCPLRDLYWAFLARHEEKLARLPRMRLAYSSLARRSAERRLQDRMTFETVREALGEGRPLHPSAPADDN